MQDEALIERANQFTLDEVAALAGAVVEHNVFEGGKTVRVTIVPTQTPGAKVIRRQFTSEAGEGHSPEDKATDFLAEHLVEAWQAPQEEGEAWDFGNPRQLQNAINAGHWGLEGSVGRAMNNAIEAGVAMLGKEPARDYWGSFIPARTQVQRHTKGSPTYALAGVLRAQE